MLTKITDMFWIDLERIVSMGLDPQESHAIVRLIDDNRDYYLAKDDFVRLINIYDKYIYGAAEKYIYGAAEKYRDKIFHER
jgi:hypothetical protein